METLLFDGDESLAHHTHDLLLNPQKRENDIQQDHSNATLF